MKLRTVATDIAAFTYGFTVSNPDKSALWQLLGDSPILQEATGEVFKLASGVILTVVSKIAFSALEKRRRRNKLKKAQEEKEKAAALIPVPVPIPEIILTNDLDSKEAQKNNN